ncbi:hypothetical protein N9980_01260 [bacterium]|nr:hypothetical protein [bacterium]
MPRLRPTPGPDDGLLDMLASGYFDGVTEETVINSEQFRYYNLDGSLVTIVWFSEEGRVTRVMRAPPSKK